MRECPAPSPVPTQGTWVSYQGSLGAQTVKNLPAMHETWVRSLDWEDPLEEGTQRTPVFLPGECPWTEEPGRLWSRRSQRAGHN